MSVIGELFSIPEDAWVDEAICPQIGDGDLWFPIKGNSARAAKSICAVCPVRAECLKYALDNKIRDGIYGGFSSRERDRLNRGGNPMRRPGRPVRRANGHGYACKCVVCRRAA